MAPEVERYRQDVAGYALAAGLRLPYGTDAVAVEVDLYPPGAKRCDIDNAMKNIMDALKGIVWPDDDRRYIRRLAIEFPDALPADCRPCAVLRVSRYEAKFTRPPSAAYDVADTLRRGRRMLADAGKK